MNSFVTAEGERFDTQSIADICNLLGELGTFCNQPYCLVEYTGETGALCFADNACAAGLECGHTGRCGAPGTFGPAELAVSQTHGVDAAGEAVVATIQYALDQTVIVSRLTLAAETFSLTSALQTYAQSVTIVGAGRTGSVIEASGVRVFDFNAVTDLILANLTVRGGDAGSGDGGCIALQGAGVSVVELTNVHVTQCSANQGAGIYTSQYVNVTVVNSTIDHNTASFGGAISSGGTTTLMGSVFANNFARVGEILLATVLATHEGNLISGCIFYDNANGLDSPVAGAIHTFGGSASHTILENSIFINGTVDAVFYHVGNVTVRDTEFREDLSIGNFIAWLPGGVATFERVLMSGASSSFLNAVIVNGLIVDDVVLAAPLDRFVIDVGAEPAIVTINNLARAGSCLEAVLTTANTTFDYTQNLADICSNSCSNLVLVTASSMDVQNVLGSYTVDGTTYVDGDILGVVLDPEDCSGPVCGSGVFAAEGSVCRHSTLSAMLGDCAGTLLGSAFVDICDECVESCPDDQVYTGDCGSRVCVFDCPAASVYNGTTCVACVGSTVCSLGEFFVDCAESSLFGSHECAPCPSGTYGNGTDCLPCTHTDCAAGEVLTACGLGSTSDVSACTPCTPGTYAAADLCTACAFTTCDPGSELTACGVAEATDVSACTVCPVGTFESGGVCTACTTTSCGAGSGFSGCVGGGMVDDASCAVCESGTFGSGTGPCEACEFTTCLPGHDFVACGMGEASDVSACMQCPVDTYDVAGDCVACSVTSCPAGQNFVQCGAQEVADVSACEPCEVGTYGVGGVCMACAVQGLSDCPVGALATTCGEAETSDVSECVTCSSMGMVTNLARTACVTGCEAGEHAMSGACFPCEHTTCANGQRLTACPAGSTSDVSSCDDCPVGSYGLNDVCTVCAVTLSDCSASQAFQGCGVAETSDVATCTTCGSLSMVVSADQLECLESCPSEQRVADQATNQCEDCSVCAMGMFISSRCNATSDTVCTPCTECNMTEITACTATADAECAASSSIIDEVVDFIEGLDTTERVGIGLGIVAVAAIALGLWKKRAGRKTMSRSKSYSGDHNNVAMRTVR